MAAANKTTTQCYKYTILGTHLSFGAKTTTCNGSVLAWKTNASHIDMLVYVGHILHIIYFNGMFPQGFIVLLQCQTCLLTNLNLEYYFYSELQSTSTHSVPYSLGLSIALHMQ
jgi:hypothetical protein